MSVGNITVAVKHPHRTAFGHYWRYHDSKDVSEGRLENIEKLNQKNDAPHHVRKVAQCSLSGDVLKMWDSQIQVKRELGIGNGTISNILTGKRLNSIYAGFIWKAV
jgi:hypothetical protein